MTSFLMLNFRLPHWPFYLRSSSGIKIHHEQWQKSTSDWKVSNCWCSFIWLSMGFKIGLVLRVLDTRFYIRKKFIGKWGSNGQNLKKIVRKSGGSIAKIFLLTKHRFFRRHCFQNVKDRIQIQVYNINNESVNHSSQFISVKVEKKLRKSQVKFWEKLRKLRLM